MGHFHFVCDIIIAPKQPISRMKSTPIRKKIRKQLPLVEPSIEHEHAFELRQIQLIIAEHLEIFDLIPDLLTYAC